MFNNKSTTKTQLLSNTIYQLIGKVLSMLITVLATVVIARVYGRESYGEFNLMQNWPAFVFIIVDFGLNAIAAREISKDWSKAEKYFSTVLFIRLILSTVFIFAMAIALTFFNYSPELKQGIRLNLLLILTQALFSTTNIIFQPKLRYDLSTIGYSAGYVFILVAVVLLSIYKVPVEWISFSYVIGGFITFFVNYGFIKKLGIRARLNNIDKNFAKNLIYQSLPLGFMFVFSQINFKSDALMLSVLNLPKNIPLNNTESVAVYGLAYKIFEVALVLPTFFMNAAYPVLVRHMQEGQSKLRKSFYLVLGALAGASVIASVIGVFLSPFMIHVIGGSQFASSVLVLQVLLSGLILYFLTQPFAWLLVTLDRQRYLPYIYLVSAVFNVTTNYFFIQKYSFYASSIITHASEFIILLLLIAFTYKAWKEHYA